MVVTDTPIRVLLAGGGTGGHLYPALRLAEGLRAHARHLGLPPPDIAFVGNPDGLEGRVLSGREELYPLRLQGFHRGSVVDMVKENSAFFWLLLRGYMQSRRILRYFKPDVVVGTGGYVSGPPLYAATRKKIPTLIQEQNSYPGITTRLLAGRVDEVHIHYQEAADYLKTKRPVRPTGNPVRALDTAIPRDEAKRRLGFDPARNLLTVIGGSQGAEPINRHLAQTLDWYGDQEPLSLLWQCGTRHVDKYQSLQSGTDSIRIQGFLDNMDVVYAASDLVIARAGALTLSELALAGNPAILIPLPTAAANHQEINATSYAREGAAEVIAQEDLPSGALEEAVANLLQSPDRLAEMTDRARAQARPNATEELVQAIYRLAEESIHVSEI